MQQAEVKEHYWLRFSFYELSWGSDSMFTKQEMLSAQRSLSEEFDDLVIRPCKGCPDCKGITYDLPREEVYD